MSSTNGDEMDGNCMGSRKTVEDDEKDIIVKDESDGLPENTAFMSVKKDASHFKMDHPKRGIALIFNHQYFTRKDCPERHGTDEDGKKLEACFRKLKFDVHLFKDLKIAEIQYQINEAAIMDHTNHDCLLVAVLSHGDQDLLHAKDDSYTPSEVIWDQFTADKCLTLAGKPKLFFLQACQGAKLDSGIRLIDRKIKNMRTEFDGAVKPYTIPVQADFLIMYATTQGYYAFRNTNDGSYFIRVLCEELERLAYKENLLTILTIIIQRVAVEFESYNKKKPEYHGKKQTPYFQCSLTRLLQFVDKTEDESTTPRPVFHSTGDYVSSL